MNLIASNLLEEAHRPEVIEKMRMLKTCEREQVVCGINRIE